MSGCTMAETFFGNDAAGGAALNLSSYMWLLAAGYACPGSGNQTVLSLDINMHDADYGGQVRCAIFTAAGAFVAQWDAAYTPAAGGWYEVGAFHAQDNTTDITPVLTGGATYFLCVGGAAGYYIRVNEVVSGVGKVYYTSSYLTGFPANLPALDNQTREPCIRCGVEAAAGGGVGLVMIRQVL